MITEMENLEPEIALLPVSGPHVMAADETIQATQKIKPGVTIPMHRGKIIGSIEDAIKFRGTPLAMSRSSLSKKDKVKILG